MAVGRVMIAVTTVYNATAGIVLKICMQHTEKSVYQCCTTSNQNLGVGAGVFGVEASTLSISLTVGGEGLPMLI